MFSYMICYMFLYSFLIRTKMLPEKVKFETFKNIEFCRNQMETATLPYINSILTSFDHLDNAKRLLYCVPCISKASSTYRVSVLKYRYGIKVVSSTVVMHPLLCPTWENGPGWIKS